MTRMKTTDHNTNGENKTSDSVGGRFARRSIPFSKGVEPDGDRDRDRSGLRWPGRDRVFEGREFVCGPDRLSHPNDAHFGLESAENERGGGASGDERVFRLAENTRGDSERLPGPWDCG